MTDEQTIRGALSLGGQLHANNAARAALDRLVARAEAAERSRDACARECHAADIARNELKSRVAALEAEVARLARRRDDYKGVVEKALVRVDALEAALRKIADMDAPTVYQQARIARAALSQPAEEGTA